MTKVCTHAGDSSREQRLLTPAIALLSAEGRDGLESRDEEGLSGGEGRRDSVFLRPGIPRPASKAYGDMAEERLRCRLIRLACWCSFSSSSISTSFISSLTPSLGDILRASNSILTPKTKNKPAAANFVSVSGMSVGTAWPRTAERTVMVIRAENAAVKTTTLGWRMAMSAATRKVLSPISEKMIIVKESTRECMGEMTAGSCSSTLLGICRLSEERMLSLGEDGFSG